MLLSAGFNYLQCGYYQLFTGICRFVRKRLQFLVKVGKSMYLITTFARFMNLKRIKICAELLDIQAVKKHILLL